ncbi:MAG: Ppx/GppA phosphatase family protein [Rhizomicrobium sp.]
MKAAGNPKVGNSKDGQGGARVRRARRAGAVAAIDLGTNNCRLLIAAAQPSGGYRVLDSYSRIVRLGEGLARTGELSDAAIARTVSALKICARRLERHAPLALRAIATEACRRARNAEALVARVRSEAGIALEIVSHDEEARLAALGCAPLLGSGFEGALIFDIGGGSTEIIRLRRNGKQVETLFAASVPFGVVTLGEGPSGGDFARLVAEVTPALAHVAQRMAAEAGPFDPAAHHLLGTSGTVTTLAGVALGLGCYDRRKIDASWHDSRTLLDVAERLAALLPAERGHVGCVGTARADLMLPGCAMFAAIHAQWPCARLRVADRGLREGILRELMQEARA